jgi:hypothetical protein
MPPAITLTAIGDDAEIGRGYTSGKRLRLYRFRFPLGLSR